jgi:hypothetical protein
MRIREAQKHMNPTDPDPHPDPFVKEMGSHVTRYLIVKLSGEKELTGTFGFLQMNLCGP